MPKQVHVALLNYSILSKYVDLLPDKTLIPFIKIVSFILGCLQKEIRTRIIAVIAQFIVLHQALINDRMSGMTFLTLN